MPKLLRVATLFLCSSVLSIGSVAALVKFDFEQKYFIEFGVEVKDHALIREDGVYHLFYLRGNPALDIGHATSVDLIHWNLEQPVLPVQPGTWDDRAVWAPHIIRDEEGGLIMYYTGVNLAWSQQTGMAYASNPYDWAKAPPWAVYHPDPTWAEWNVDSWSHGRDPFVFEYGGRFYLLNTAKTLGNKGAISLASSSDRYNWVDEGPLYVHNNWHVLESVQLLEYNGRFHLFFTEQGIFGTSHMPSDSLFSGWNIANRSLIDFGHAPEINQFDDGHFVFSRHATHNYGDGSVQFAIRIDTLRWWNGMVPYIHKPWPLANDWILVWGSTFLYGPTFLNNPTVRGENVDVGYEGFCWLSSYERYQGPLGIGTEGDFQGDAATGLIRSKTFTISGNSMSLLVGGGDYPDECYVALVDASTEEVFFKETGKNTDEMDRRYWDLYGVKGRNAYIEIMDNSTGPFGHISCDDIVESFEFVGNRPDPNEGEDKRRRNPFQRAGQRAGGPAGGSGVELYQNSPNPFNPSTTISYYLPAASDVVLEVFDVGGRLVRRLLSGTENRGTHHVTWDGRNEDGTPLSTGIYFYRLRVDGAAGGTKKMILLK